VELTDLSTSACLMCMEIFISISIVVGLFLKPIQIVNDKHIRFSTAVEEV